MIRHSDIADERRAQLLALFEARRYGLTLAAIAEEIEEYRGPARSRGERMLYRDVTRLRTCGLVVRVGIRGWTGGRGWSQPHPVYVLKKFAHLLPDAPDKAADQ